MNSLASLLSKNAISGSNGGGWVREKNGELEKQRWTLAIAIVATRDSVVYYDTIPYRSIVPPWSL